MDVVAGWHGGPVGDWAEAVLAPNPGPMTLDGTNTWIVQEPGADRATVVDPGPLHEGHLVAVLTRVQERGARVQAIVLTHHHPDHTEGAERFAQLSDAPITGARIGGVPPGLRTVATPGHTADSICLLAPQAGLLLTGDTVLGRGTTVIARPDGSLRAYLGSLRRLRDVVRDHGVTHVLPGHGPARDRPAALIEEYLTHREQRLAQVRRAVAEGAGTAADVVRTVYADVPEELWPAAEASVQAQLDYLREESIPGSAG